MNTYGQTACPKCGSLNNMYRPLDICKNMPRWDETICWNCGNQYKHTDKINNITTEADQVKAEGRA